MKTLDDPLIVPVDKTGSADGATIFWPVTESAIAYL